MRRDLAEPTRRGTTVLVAAVGVVTSAAAALAGHATAATTNTWTGASLTSANWSDPANWSGGIPASGQALSFPSGASRLTNTNDLTGLSVDSIAFGAKDYDISGNGITVQSGIAVGNIQ